jgi:hypothetical protein
MYNVQIGELTIYLYCTVEVYPSFTTTSTTGVFILVLVTGYGFCLAHVQLYWIIVQYIYSGNKPVSIFFDWVPLYSAYD